MGPISLTTAVDAPRERVFEFICDLSRRPDWTDHFAGDFRLQRLESSGKGAAARFRVNAPRGIGYMDTTIVEAERPHAILEQGHGGRLNRIALYTSWELTAGPGAVTTVTLTFWIEPGGRRGGRWWRKRWKRALRRLRESIESGSASEHRAAVAGGSRRLTGIA